MVDSIKGLGSLPKVLVGKTSSDDAQASGKKPGFGVIEDKVQISPEALSQKDAEKIAVKTRDDLQKLDVNLSGARSELIRGDTI